MQCLICLLFLMAPQTTTTAAAAANPNPFPPFSVVALDVKPKDAVFNGSNLRTPAQISAADELSRYFEADQIKRITKRVDFKKQYVLLFVWRGSGQDRLRYDYQEVKPGWVFFTIKQGRTEDYRRHARVFAVQSDVKWKMN